VKVKIIDSMGSQYRCDSADPYLIGRWFMEHAYLLAKQENGVLPMYLHMWPSTPAERDMLGSFNGEVTPLSLRSLASALAEVADVLDG
jgi:hypothetical protein